MRRKIRKKIKGHQRSEKTVPTLCRHHAHNNVTTLIRPSAVRGSWLVAMVTWEAALKKGDGKTKTKKRVYTHTHTRVRSGGDNS